MPKEKKTEQTTKIVRGYNRTIQVKQYEPINVFCSRELEVPLSQEFTTSKKLFELCVEDVERDLAEMIKVLSPAPEKPIYKQPNDWQRKTFTDNRDPNTTQEEAKEFRFEANPNIPNTPQPDLPEDFYKDIPPGAF